MNEHEKPGRKRSGRLQATGLSEDEERTKETPAEEAEERDDGEHQDQAMSFVDHLDELRSRLFRVAFTTLTASAICGFFVDDIHRWLSQPYFALPNARLIMESMYGPLNMMIELSLLVGFAISLPISLGILWGFITPAVSRKMARIGNAIVFSSSVLFWFGAAICWRFVFPVSLQFLLVDFLPEGVDRQLSIEKYYSFLFMLHVGAGLLFQLPLVFVLLGAAGIVSFAWHQRVWRYVVVIIFIFAAIVTPPDPVSQVILSAPLLALYAASVLIVWLIEKRRR